ncbi:MAG: bifunctional phosphoribosylaminoimidazolecarboxamide formyltransferase/IMP cyclohydrolase [Planctomycetes bacterium]|nr:bifunctional phosphoribosylaminoimidazolecarboxamide formyltransferase/IMP cyclohydrolase [Planctomycetota bacterium]
MSAHAAPSLPAPNLVKVTRALISVSDKTGLLDLARALISHNVEIISTGGTAAALTQAGIPVTPIDAVTQFPEMMDGRVKTLHPKVHGGLLAVRNNPAHVAAMKEHGIAPIDLVCINLYPFEATIAKPNVTLHDAVENIDIGGPSMVRSAAKNSNHVLILTSPAQYAATISALAENLGQTTLALRRSCAAHAFATTAAYDAAISAYLAAQWLSNEDLPSTLNLPLSRSGSLRYGENPHQPGSLYTGPALLGSGIPQANQLHGKELSYNNINDAAAALSLSRQLAALSPTATSAVIVKHANPCGAATASTPLHAISDAIAGDPLAAYGGIIAVSSPIDEAAAARLCTKDVFFEVLIAPDYSPAALDALRTRWQNLRILKVPSSLTDPTFELRSVPGGILIQKPDRTLAVGPALVHAAGPAPSAPHLAVARFLEPVCRALNSNAVCIGGIGEHSTPRLFGAGAGQMDRVASCTLAVAKAGPHAKGAVAFSDAFFPFSDGPTILTDAGITCIVHPGGSKRDQDTFDLCNSRGITCLTTGIRHFRH